MKLQLIRHATLWLEYGGVRFLIDPMFSEKEANPPIPGTANERRNPLVALPTPLETWLQPDAVIVTHLHPDHWDEAAAAALSKSIPVVCQPGDEAKIAASGFESVTAVASALTVGGVSLSRTSGQHGTGEIGIRMGQVSGFVLQAEGEPTVYIAGDTIWCDDVQHALDTYRPQVTIVNAGGARFTVGDPITMNADDVISVCQYAPYTKVVAVHMDAINHCLTTRSDLQVKLSECGLSPQVAIPRDGEWI